jgi:hypothetical protein
MFGTQLAIVANALTEILNRYPILLDALRNKSNVHC